MFTTNKDNYRQSVVKELPTSS